METSPSKLKSEPDQGSDLDLDTSPSKLKSEPDQGSDLDLDTSPSFCKKIIPVGSIISDQVGEVFHRRLLLKRYTVRVQKSCEA